MQERLEKGLFIVFFNEARNSKWNEQYFLSYSWLSDGNNYVVDVSEHLSDQCMGIRTQVMTIFSHLNRVNVERWCVFN